ncbi:Pls/PosA family non-ribosomal peptide synthetase [Kocuria tytonicola]|uniref:Pls/PosA family non-ribosomal peptide synthetase n=1 Tax=Kocuria tytonicola TaxID=2055946 RepID=UPI001FB56DC0|nr:Pls/PosA family non-ribosomal peptide synthetase [Kocuria tytonicola]
MDSHNLSGGAHAATARPGEAPDRAVYPVEQPPAPRTLVDIVLDTVAQYPDAIALEDENESVPYGELEDRIEAHVQRLWDLGIGRGDRVGVRVPSGGVDLYVAILATLFAGAAYVPVDWDDPDERAQTVWQEAGVAAVFGEGLELTRNPAVRSGEQTETPRTRDDAWIIFTSGSTGKPKGVAISHRSAAALVDAEAQMYLQRRPLGPGDRVMAGLSVAFDASCEEMWLAWRHGATLVPAPRSIVRSGPDLGQWIVDRQITAVSTVPTLASLWPSEALDRVRLLIFGGEACPLELTRHLVRPGREVWNTYGPTEATVIATGALLTGEAPVRIGLAVPGWELAVVDSQGEPVAWGETGELIIGGVGLGRYLDPEKDAEKYAPLESLGWERAYRSGDVVRADPEGIVFAGRADDQVKVSGRRIELGEIDTQMTEVPGVRLGACAVHSTPGGGSVIAGYLVPESEGSVDLTEARRWLVERLPGGMVPALCVMDELPMKTSGKVDRKALPWPLPNSNEDGSAPLQGDLAWLAELWADQLGPLPFTADSDFFAMGGSSVALARLVSALRRTHPDTEIAKIYAHPTLEAMAGYLATLGESHDVKRDPEPVPAPAGWLQGLFLLALNVVNGFRYVLGSMIVVWVLAVVADAGWVPRPPLLPLVLGWLVMFSLPGRVLVGAATVRALTAGLRPGHYRRGSWTHLRVWAAERVVVFNKYDVLTGTPMARWLHRLFGNTVGRDAHLYNTPPVTGLVSVGDHATVEFEADLSGYWLDGDVFHVGAIEVGEHARVGTRTLVDPGMRVGAGAEVLPGSHVSRSVPDGELWGGSPLRHHGSAGLTWPEESPEETGGLRTWGPVRSHLMFTAGAALVGLLPFLALIPGALLVLTRVVTIQEYEVVFPIVAVWVPVFTVVTAVVWLLLVVAVVRLVSGMIVPGYFPQNGPVGWAMWLTETLMQRTLISTYPVYASCITPWFMRLLGATVGRNVEISTAETIPHLTTLKDGSFLADHALVTSHRAGFGWLHVGTSVIGERTFVGNSGIVGPDRDLPADALVAVLSSAPHHAPAGSSWLGRTAEPIARARTEADTESTFQPQRRLKAARAFVELFRFLPAMVSAWLDLLVVYVLTDVYMSHGMGWSGVLAALAWSGVVLSAASTAACLVPVLVKWALMGRFRPSERPLFSSFVWRNELTDVFAESLAVPSMIRLSVGSPMFTAWARLMGAHIGRGVWCETWWLPEFDLVQLEDNVSVNRGTVLQTHLFHDRIMRMEPVTMRRGSTLGPNSFVLPGATIEERTTVAPGSLVMRQETVPSDGNWGGNPIRHLAPGDQVVSAQVAPTAAPASRRGAHAASSAPEEITQHGAGSTAAPAAAGLPTAQHEGVTE